MHKIDARGLSCPKPVIETKKLIDRNKELKNIVIIVDNQAALENVSKFLSSQNFEVSIEEKENEKIISGVKSKNVSNNTEIKTDSTSEIKTIILISNDQIGSGDKTLGSKLIINFLATLDEYGDNLWKIIFVNSGVKLTAEIPETIESLRKLEKKGVEILVCGTCLEHYNLIEKKAVGSTTNMLDIVTSMEVSEKIISL